MTLAKVPHHPASKKHRRWVQRLQNHEVCICGSLISAKATTLTQRQHLEGSKHQNWCQAHPQSAHVLNSNDHMIHQAEGTEKESFVGSNNPDNPDEPNLSSPDAHTPLEPVMDSLQSLAVKYSDPSHPQDKSAQSAQHDQKIEQRDTAPEVKSTRPPASQASSTSSKSQLAETALLNKCACGATPSQRDLQNHLSGKTHRKWAERAAKMEKKKVRSSDPAPGIKCGCGASLDQGLSRATLQQHIRGQKHQTWVKANTGQGQEETQEKEREGGQVTSQSDAKQVQLKGVKSKHEQNDEKGQQDQKVYTNNAFRSCPCGGKKNGHEKTNKHKSWLKKYARMDLCGCGVFIDKDAPEQVKQQHSHGQKHQKWLRTQHTTIHQD